LVGLLVGWFFGWLVGWLVGLLVGWLVACLFVDYLLLRDLSLIKGSIYDVVHCHGNFVKGFWDF
jgi:hypothetical protein